MPHRPMLPAYTLALATMILHRSRPAHADGENRPGSNPPAPSFTRDIRPILAAHCLKCHGATTQKADLDLSSPATMAKGGSSGPAIEPGVSSNSLLYEQVSKHVMPPGKAAKLTAAEIRLIARWIDAGAPADGAKHDPAAAIAPTHWAFRPPVKSVPPAVQCRLDSTLAG